MIRLALLCNDCKTRSSGLFVLLSIDRSLSQMMIETSVKPKKKNINNRKAVGAKIEVISAKSENLKSTIL